MKWKFNDLLILMVIFAVLMFFGTAVWMVVQNITSGKVRWVFDISSAFLFISLMPIDLVHNDFFALYKPRVCNCFSGNARHYKAIEKLSFPETSVEPITNFGKIGL